MSLPLHGSNPDYLYNAFRIPKPDKIIDFSVNLNPFGPPGKLIEKWPKWVRYIEDYPDPHGKAVIEMISESEGISDTSIMLGNGGAELITLIASYFSGQHIGVIQPTFSEYESVSTAYGSQVTYIHLTEGDWHMNVKDLSRKLPSLNALFLCHPNNPTGTTYSRSQLSELLKACEEHHCYLVVDEAFIDFLDEELSLAEFVADSDNIIIIRSLTKMYSIAGLRLGFLMANEQLVAKLKSRQPHWSVNALALEAGKEILNEKEKEYVHKTKQFIQQERNRMMTELTSLGYQVSNSKVNFYLLKDPLLDNHRLLIKYLLKKGIVARHTENFPGLDGRWLRLAIRQTKENNQLLEALKLWKEEN